MSSSMLNYTLISQYHCKSIDYQDIKESFESELCAKQQIGNLHQAVNTYNSKMGQILDASCPPEDKEVETKP